jgi:hypothetical protein
VVRNGAVSLDQLREHVPGVLGLGEIPMAAEEPEEPQAVDTPGTADALAASDTPEAAQAPESAPTAAAEAHTAPGSSAVSSSEKAED